MSKDLILSKQDLTYLAWATVRQSSGTAGSFLKAYSEMGGRKIYYKLSNFDSSVGVTGHECVNELIVDRLLTLLGVRHLHYQLIHADIRIDDMIYETYLSASEDYKRPVFNSLKESDRWLLMNGLDAVISENMQDRIWEMIWGRWCAYEDFCSSR